MIYVMSLLVNVSSKQVKDEYSLLMTDDWTGQKINFEEKLESALKNSYRNFIGLSED